MFGARSTSKFGAWRLEGYPQVVEYAQPVIEQVIADVAAGFGQFPHGGMAVGGILFGEGDRHLVRILATRPMPCEHSTGPSFTLSENDHADLESVIAAAREDPELAGLTPVGWFHSHNRTGLTLTRSDLVVHQRHFHEAWQVALLVCPEEGGPARAGLFVRQADGTFPVQPHVKIDDLRSCLSESVQIERPVGEVRTAPETGTIPTAGPWSHQDADSAVDAPAAAAPEGPAPAEAPDLFAGFSAPSREAKEKKSGRWIGVAAAIALVIGGLWSAGRFLIPPEYWEAVRFYASSPTEYFASVVDFWERKAAASEEYDLSLRALGSGANLLIRWDSTSLALTETTGGLLEIDDGVHVERIPLNLEKLIEGSYAQLRTSDNVGVQLTLFGESGKSILDSTRFVGSVVGAGTSAAAQVDTPETLRADLEGLRSAIAMQSEQRANLRASLNMFQELRAARANSAPLAAPAAPSATPAAPSAAPSAAPKAAPSAVRSPAPARPRASLAQTRPAGPAPPVFEQKPANLPASTTPSSAAKPAYRGPRSGRLIWTGFLADGQVLVIGGSSASVGSLSGGLPGVPVEVSVSPGELTGGGLTVYSGNTRYQSSPATEEPNQNNAWNKTTIRYDSAQAQAAAVVEKPAAANGWKRLSVRANGRTLSVLVVSWSVTE